MSGTDLDDRDCIDGIESFGASLEEYKQLIQTKYSLCTVLESDPELDQGKTYKGKRYVLVAKRWQSDLVYIVGGDSNYSEFVKVCVGSIQRFSNHRILVYGYDYMPEFEYPNMLKRQINVDALGTKMDARSLGSSFAKELCCIDAIESVDSKAYVWVDADSFASPWIDRISQYIDQLGEFPLINSHFHDAIVTDREPNGEAHTKLAAYLDVTERTVYPWLHACLMIFGKDSLSFFQRVYDTVLKMSEFDRGEFFFVMSDELVLNVLLWKYKATQRMGVHDFDVFAESSMDKYLENKLELGYRECMPRVNDNITSHCKLPTTKKDIYILHGCKDLEQLKRMYGKFLTEPYVKPVFHTTELAGPVNLAREDAPTFSLTYREVFSNNDYEWGPCEFGNSKVVIDCGANLGMFSSLAFLKGAERVLSFEPERSNFNILERNVPGAELFNCAVGKELTRGELFIHTCEGGHSLQDNNINHTQTGTKQSVDITTLDHVIDTNELQSIDFLKIDTEGAELDIIAGVSNRNLLKIKRIVMEYHNMIYDMDVSLRDKLVERLKGSGFNVHVRMLDKNQHLQMIYAWRGEPIKVITHFIDGPFCEILGASDAKYRASFIDLNRDNIEYFSILEANNWARPARKFTTKWLITLDGLNGNNFKYRHNFNPDGQKVLIWLDSKSLGDTLAWIPYVEEYRVVHDCEVYVSTWWNDLLTNAYPELKFTLPGSSVGGLYASFCIGVFDGDENRHKHDWRTIPLQQVATDILGLEYTEQRPRVSEVVGTQGVSGDYVCMSEFSTAKAKFWNFHSGWNELNKNLVEAGYKVVSISKESTGLKKDYLVRLNNRSIADTITTLRGAKAFIGVGSGLAWLAWALGVPVVMISGFSEKFCEFRSNNVRITNEDVCHGCFNDPRHNFDRGDWYWCPRGNDFECTKTITPKMVLDGVMKVLK